MDVVAIADSDAARLATVGDSHAIAACHTDALALLATENLDVVSICLPNNYHLPLTLSAIDAGCHALCEKPMALSAAEGRLMLDAARRPASG